MNLLEAYRALHSKRGALTAALNGLSLALGADYDLARFGQWRRGERPVPPEVQSYLRRAVLADYQQRHARQKFSVPMINEIIALCEPPEPREWPTTRECYAARLEALRGHPEQEG